MLDDVFNKIVFYSGVLVSNKQLPCLQRLILSNFNLTAEGSRITSVGLNSFINDESSVEFIEFLFFD